MLALSSSTLLGIEGALPAWAATSIDPALRWKTIETQNFLVHYYLEEEPMAKKLAVIAEEVRAIIGEALQHYPRDKVHVVLMDSADYTVDYAEVFPNPKITLYMTSITSNSHGFDYANWLRFVFIHEYTHVTHLDTVEGPGKFYQMIMGRAFFPNQYLPWFIIEGLSTYLETRYTTGGRGDDPYWNAWMRMEVLEDDMKTIDQASVYTTLQWPGGNTKYLYGVSFMRYLSETYGDDLLARLNKEYGDFMFSYGIDPLFKSIYGAPLGIIWIEWQEYLKKKYEAEKKRIEAWAPLTQPQLLTQSGEEKYNPCWSPDSKYLYYNYNTVDDVTSIRRLAVDTLKEEKVLEGILYDDKFSVHDQSLYYSRGQVYKNFYVYKDLYVMNTQDRKSSRLSWGARASDPSVSLDGQKMAFVRNYLGTKTLWMIDEKGQQKMLRSADGGFEYFSPIFSPDGKKMVYAKWSPQYWKQDICLLDLATDQETKILSTASFEANPCFSPDGNFVLFDSDRTGVVNIYAYDLTQNQLYQVTNVLGIAQMPAVSPDGSKLAYVNYSAKGYDVALIDFDPAKWIEAPLENTPAGIADLRPLPQPATGEAVIKSISDYNSLKYLLPKFWVPYSYYNENGLQTLLYTAATDPIGKQSYFLQGGYDWTGHRPTYTFLYTNNQLLPQIGLLATDMGVPYKWESGIYWERQNANSLFLSFYQNGIFNWYDHQIFSLGYEGLSLSSISSIESFTTKPNTGNLKSVALAYRYSSLRSYPASISYEDGIDLSGRVAMYSKETGSDYTFTRYSGELSRYFSLPLKRHVLLVDAIGIYSFGQTLTQGSFSWKSLPIRGYPSNIIYGSKGTLGLLEYRFPIANPEMGINYGYIFFNRLWGAVYGEYGGATTGSFRDMLWRRSLGAEVNLDTSNMYGMMAFKIKIGLAKGLDEGGQDQFYFTVAL